ncbi:hypothetical protein Vadar_014196 [Vaccinium darrowii]|uniref:Uncharacterized protein n=1 Tax=Vaccinium darrowii TaxID=229202 RepID=A0ACB7X0Z4_9ERIC|nr:hypothetical protein Vadar_014196 [Vaccinium darrowii]
MTKSPSTIDFSPYGIKIQIDLESYEAADIQTSDGSLVDRTNQVITSLATGVEVKALSFDSLKQGTELLVDMNQEVVKVILKFKQDIRETPELFELVKEFFENSSQTLNFCSDLEKCLERARDRQSLILETLRAFDEESGLQGGNNGYVKTLEGLKNFKDAGDPFPDKFVKIFQTFCIHQKSILDKLETRKQQLEEKLNTSQAWRMICSIIFATMITGVLIFSVVGAVIAAPPVGVALAAASEPLLACMGTWIDSRWKKFKNAVKGQKDVVQSIVGHMTMEGYVGSRIVIADLDNIRVIIEKLEIDVKYLLKNVDNIHRKPRKKKKIVVKEDEVRKEIQKINKKMEEFNRNVEHLGEHTGKCIQDVRRARTVVLYGLIKPHNS